MVIITVNIIGTLDCVVECCSGDCYHGYHWYTRLGECCYCDCYHGYHWYTRFYLSVAMVIVTMAIIGILDSS